MSFAIYNVTYGIEGTGSPAKERRGEEMREYSTLGIVSPTAGIFLKKMKGFQADRDDMIRNISSNFNFSFN